MRINTDKKYYVISLKHTKPGDRFITLWGPNDTGYFYNRHQAGIYEGYDTGYHDSGSMPVEVSDLESLFVYSPAGQGHESGFKLPNRNSTWNKIGHLLVRGKLVKIQE